MTRQAESERYLNVVSVVHGGGEADIRLGMTLSTRRSAIIRSAIMESASAWASLGEGARTARWLPGLRRLPRIYSRHAINPGPIHRRRNAYPAIRGGSVVRRVLRSRDFEDGEVAESSTCGPGADFLKQISSSRVRPGRSSAAGSRCARVARTCGGGAGFQRPSRSGRPLRDLTGYAPRPGSMPAVFPIPSAGRIFPALRGT